jgi:hypothetical protein
MSNLFLSWPIDPSFPNPFSLRAKGSKKVGVKEVKSLSQSKKGI